MQRRRALSFPWIFVVYIYLSSAFQESKGKQDVTSTNNDKATTAAARRHHHVFHNTSSQTDGVGKQKDDEAHKKRYVIEVQDRQQAVKLANPIVDLEDSVQRGINDPLADPRFVMNRINDDFFDAQKHHSLELMNYQNRGRFSSAALGSNTHLLRPLPPVTENALKETVISKHARYQDMDMTRHSPMALPRRAPLQLPQRSPIRGFPGVGMSLNQQFAGLGIQIPNQQIQALQRQPIAQLSNIALGGQLTSGMPALTSGMPSFNIPRQPDIGGASISVLKQPNSDTMTAMPMMGMTRFAAPAMLPGLTLSGQQGIAGNILSSFLSQQGMPQQQEMAQQQGIALQNNFPPQLRDLTLPQPSPNPISQPQQNLPQLLQQNLPRLPQTARNWPENARSPPLPEPQRTVPADVRSPDNAAPYTESEQSLPDKADRILSSLRHPRPKSSPMKVHRKMLPQPPRRFVSRTPLPGTGGMIQKHVRPIALKARSRNIRPHMRAPQQRPAKKAHKDLSYDELTGLPNNLENNNEAGAGVSSITAVSDPVPPPSTVTIDTGGDATEVGDTHDTSATKETTKGEENKPKTSQTHDGPTHDNNGGSHDSLGGLDGGGGGGGAVGGENLDSIKEYLQADNILRDKLNKDSGGGGGGAGGGDDGAQKGSDLSDADISVGPMVGEGGGDKSLNGGDGGYGDEGMKPIDIGG